MRSFLFVALLPALLVGLPAQGASETVDDAFPVEAEALFLTTATDQTRRLLLPNIEGEAGQEVFSPPLAASGAVPDSQSWFWHAEADKDREIVGTTNTVLYLSAQFQAVAIVKVELAALAPDGGVRLLTEYSRTLTVQAVTPAPFDFALDTDGLILHAGESFRLRISVDGASAASILDYGAEETPSRIQTFASRWLDSDLDGVADSDERAIGTNPLDPTQPGDARLDTDRDGLSDALEGQIGTDSTTRDTDGDGWGDGAEFYLGTNPLDASDMPVDSDGDGLPDPVETDIGTDPNQLDSDNDGISDCDEDADEDGLSNCRELDHGTNPLLVDTDGDGITDGEEVTRGTDPRVHPSPPGDPREAWELVAGSLMFIAASALALVGLFVRHAL